jgi:hypothetical protein
MKRSKRIMLTALGMAHLIVAIALLPLATFFGFFGILVVVPGLIWLTVLGVRLLRSNVTVRTAMRVTHLVLAPVAALLVVYGVYCLRAAERSAADGGGLLGTFGLVPIVMGALAGSLSMVSLCVAFSSVLPKTSGTGQHAQAPRS